MLSSITRAAPAKLNLTLRVVGRRPDGYHLLDSVVAFAAYGDEITVAPAGGLSLEIDGPFGARLAALPGRNLVLRAAEALAEALGRPATAAIRLTKNLPIASGIGGGSADAAATLLALSSLWRQPLAPDRLADLGAALGADLPVCLLARTARVRGIGERIERMPAVPAVPIVLVNPGVAVSTPDVFRRRSGDFSDAAEAPLWDEPPSDGASLAALLSGSANDLMPPALALCPAVREVLSALSEQDSCLLARMSGSGATCYGLFADAAAATVAATTIRSAAPGWWAVATSLRDGGSP